MEDALPYFLSIGVSYDRFMDSCPVELKPFSAALKLSMSRTNQMYHIQGLYVREAIMSTIGNSQWFKGKGHPAHEYPREPYQLFGEEKKMTKQEIQAEVDKFYAQEAIRRANWKHSHKKKNNQGEVAQ